MLRYILKYKVILIYLTLVVLIFCAYRVNNKDVVFKIGKLKVTNMHIVNELRSHKNSGWGNQDNLDYHINNYIDKCFLVASAYDKKIHKDQHLKLCHKWIKFYSIAKPNGYLDKVLKENKILSKSENVQEWNKIVREEILNCVDKKSIIKFANLIDSVNIKDSGKLNVSDIKLAECSFAEQKIVVSAKEFVEYLKYMSIVQKYKPLKDIYEELIDFMVLKYKMDFAYKNKLINSLYVGNLANIFNNLVLSTYLQNFVFSKEVKLELEEIFDYYKQNYKTIRVPRFFTIKKTFLKSNGYFGLTMPHFSVETVPL